MRNVKRFLLLLAVAFCAVGVYAAQNSRTPFSENLQRVLRSRSSVTENPQTGRFLYMRFYVPHENFLQGPDFWERWFNSGVKEKRVRAMAYYLLQMYVSAAAYGEDVPSVLGADYLGALDGFMMLGKPFDFAKAASFYKENKTEIQEHLKEFFRQSRLPEYQPQDPSNERRELAFASLLSRAPAPGFPKGAYRISARALQESAALDAQDVAAWMRETAAEAGQKVVLFEMPEVSLEDFDSPLASAGSKMGYYYRSVIDECHYLSYLLARRIVRNLSQASPVRQVYRIQARPLRGAYLRAAQGGDHFLLASGEYSAQWDYHTAVLLVMKRGGRISLEVADRFLFGETPVPLQTWLKKFDPSNTAVSAEPFYRNETIENAIKTPQRKQGNNVVVGGRTYKPYPVRP